MLTIRGLCKGFAGPPPRSLFRNLNLELQAGELAAIMGESGCGKSTLLNLIAGLDRADGGTITMDNVELNGLDDNARTLHRRSQLGFIFQAFHLLPYLNVADNVGLPLLLLGCGPQERDERVLAMLQRVSLGNRAAAKPRDLSGGEMQRVAIARALVHRPRLVLADEPTGNLDAHNAHEVLAALRDCVAGSQTGCLLVTHSSIAARTADRTLLLDGGTLQARTTP
jgi:putative ABC transport system ATP-binding protein